jgi:hypothetical protein
VRHRKAWMAAVTCWNMLSHISKHVAPFIHPDFYRTSEIPPLLMSAAKIIYLFPLQKNHYLFLGQKKCDQWFIVLRERLVMGWKFHIYYIPIFEASKFYSIPNWHSLEQIPCTKILSLLPVWVGISLSCLQFISNDVHIFWEKRTFNFATFNHPFFPL